MEVEEGRVIETEAENQMDEHGTGGANILEESQSRCRSLRVASHRLHSALVSVDILAAEARRQF